MDVCSFEHKVSAVEHRMIGLYNSSLDLAISFNRQKSDGWTHLHDNWDVVLREHSGSEFGHPICFAFLPIDDVTLVNYYERYYITPEVRGEQSNRRCTSLASRFRMHSWNITSECAHPCFLQQIRNQVCFTGVMERCDREFELVRELQR